MFKGGLEIYADGGCHRNGAEDAEAHGSFFIRALLQNRIIAEKHSGILDYPDLNTNNAAELQTFIKAMTRRGRAAGFRNGSEKPCTSPAADVPLCSGAGDCCRSLFHCECQAGHGTGTPGYVHLCAHFATTAVKMLFIQMLPDLGTECG
jgi:hypothetical protein